MTTARSLLFVVALALAGGAGAFQRPALPAVARSVALQASTPNDDRLKMMQDDAMDKDLLADTAKRMQSMTAGDLDMLMQQMSNMDPGEKEQLKAMGMDPVMMEKSMKMMRDNPAIMQSAQKMMSTMTPEQMMEQSKRAQQKMAEMTPEQMDAAAQAISSAGRIEPNSAKDPVLIETMFKAAEYMALPPTGGVTFKSFSTLAPIAALLGERDSDLTQEELEDCWATGANGAERVDRLGFAAVWAEVQDYFEDDIMAEARDPELADARANGVSKPAAEEDDTVQAEIVGSTGASAGAGMGMGAGMGGFEVGANLNPDQMAMMSEQMKQMSPDDMSKMLDQMSNMSPEQEARMKAMGVDPRMMKSSLKVMKDNPMMMKAAQAMMSRMSPDQMMQMSKQAQDQMSKMSPEEREKAIERMNRGEMPL